MYYNFYYVLLLIYSFNISISALASRKRADKAKKS